MSVTHYGCVSVCVSEFLRQLSGMQIESVLRRIMLSAVACMAYYIFPRYFINGTIFEKKKSIGYKLCVLIICIICV